MREEDLRAARIFRSAIGSACFDMQQIGEIDDAVQTEKDIDKLWKNATPEDFEQIRNDAVEYMRGTLEPETFIKNIYDRLTEYH